MEYKNSDIQEIQNKLVRFGLNPTEWKVCPITKRKSDKIILQNKSDASFQILGKLKKGMALELEALQLLTI